MLAEASPRVTLDQELKTDDGEAGRIMKCPQCGADAAGKFCAECGTEIRQAVCPSCGKAVQVGASFCIFCGAPLRRRRPVGASAGGKRVLWATGLFAGVLIVGAGYWALARDEVEEAPAPRPAAGLTPTAGMPPDLSSMTPREAADRLYDRIMRAASAGDTAEALAFLPMALDAYDLVFPLDADGHYHVSLLHALGGDYQMAREAAEGALADAPNHLLLLGAAAQAASQLGDDDGANAYYARFMEAWDSEQARGLEEYSMHAIPLAEMRAAAEVRAGG